MRFKHTAGGRRADDQTIVCGGRPRAGGDHEGVRGLECPGGGLEGLGPQVPKDPASEGTALPSQRATPSVAAPRPASLGCIVTALAAPLGAQQAAVGTAAQPTIAGRGNPADDAVATAVSHRAPRHIGRVNDAACRWVPAMRRSSTPQRRAADSTCPTASSRASGVGAVTVIIQTTR